MESGPLVYLDANVLIAMIEGPETSGRHLQSFFEASGSARQASFHTSALCLAELFVKPYRDIDMALVEMYSRLVTSPKLSLHPVNGNVLDTATVIRVVHRLKLPDAIHLATESVVGRAYFLTFDKGFVDLEDIAHPVHPLVRLSPVKIVQPTPSSLAELSEALS